MFALLLAVVLVLGLAAPAMAATTMRSVQKLTVNGEAVECDKYNIDGYNYFKLRDLAKLLDGTNSQFNVDYDQAAKMMVVTTGVPYTTPNGTELQVGEDQSASAVPSVQSLMIDGEMREDLTAYNIGGNNYFQLRELGKALHFYVHYDVASKTMLVDESEEDEAWDTGDAGLDNPRNQDGIGEKEILVVSFGTSFNDSRRETIGAVEAAMEKAFPEMSVRRGFTAQIVIDHIALRDDETIDNFGEAIQRALDNGVKELYVQPTHLMNGFEYIDVMDELSRYQDRFDVLCLGDPILTTDEDFDVVIEAITEATKQYDDGKTAICFMGHGTEAESNHVYADMQAKLTEKGYANYYVGTVEAEPSVYDVLEQVKAGGYTKVVLRPLMIVAGDHANNDMADLEDEESWASIFTAAGYEVECVLEGLGQLPAIQKLLVEHARDAENLVPKRDLADAGDMTAVDEVVEEGMTPITGDKVADGEYKVEVKSSSSMFKVSNAVLTVKDGKMSLTFSTTKSYTWFFLGATDKIADADLSEFQEGKLSDGAMTYTIPVEALDEGILCAAYSRNKDQWYARTLLVRYDSLEAIG